MTHCASETRRRCRLGEFFFLALLLVMGAAVPSVEGRRHTMEDSAARKHHLREKSSSSLLSQEVGAGPAEQQLAGVGGVRGEGAADGLDSLKMQVAEGEEEAFLQDPVTSEQTQQHGAAAGGTADKSSPSKYSSDSEAAQRVRKIMAARAAASKGKTLDQMHGEVMEELKQHPVYKAQKERNDKDAQERADKINRWIEEDPSRLKSTKSNLDEKDPTARAKYEKVLEELKKRYEEKKAKSASGETEQAASVTKTTQAKPHDFLQKEEAIAVA